MSEPADLIPGAEAWSADGGPAGVLVIHGFTGNPGSMRGLAEALAAAGFTVDLPRLPGHGTKVEDMIPTRFDGLARRRRGALRRPRRALRPGRGRRSLDGRCPDGVAGVRAPRDRRAGADQRHRVRAAGHAGAGAGDGRRRHRDLRRHRLGHRRSRPDRARLPADAGGPAPLAARRRRRAARASRADHVPLPGREQPAGPRGAAREQPAHRRVGEGSGRAVHRRAQLPRRHPGLRPRRDRSRHGRVRPDESPPEGSPGEPNGCRWFAEGCLPSTACPNASRATRWPTSPPSPACR